MHDGFDPVLSARHFVCSLVAAVLAAAGHQAVAAPNVLLILADDMGVEALSVYGLGETAPTTAALEEIAGQGVVFRNFWSQPVCSPTRATIMTGRYGFRTGVGRPIAPAAGGGGSGPLPPPLAKPDGAPYETPGMGRRVENPISRGLRADESMLPQALDAGTEGAYRTAAIGKWHMADADNGWLDHPRRAGIDFYSAIMHGEDSYFTWRKNLNGEVVRTTDYGAIDHANTAIEWIREQGDEPWFMWLSFILPHTPLHLPPRELLQSDYSDLNPEADTRDSPIRYFHAMIEAMDTSIGRVLDSMDPEVRENTYVIFIGDNGTGGGSITAPFQSGRAKGTVYQGGVNVPLIVSGPGVVAGGVSEALINSADLYATILEMAETDVAEAVPAGVNQDSLPNQDLEQTVAYSSNQHPVNTAWLTPPWPFMTVSSRIKWRPNADRHRRASSPHCEPQQRWYARPEPQLHCVSRTVFPHIALARPGTSHSLHTANVAP